MKTKSSSSGNVYTRILDDIGSGTFPSGTRLKVQALADRYGTSIIPVREALRLLQGEGLVTIARNKGAAVSELNAEMILEIFEILQLMEPYFVKAFVKSCTAEDIARLQDVQDKIRTTPVADKAAFTALDKQFHEIIARRHYNRRAYDIWELQRRILNALALPVPISTARHQAILKEHESLIDAFKRSDEADALACINQHVQGAGDQMYVQLKQLDREA
ncbi:GntR family transcriptional regulator [Fluviibacterium sp. DFM31]|uniref:GntR family transcriptional regulator n=1 Tax=Meridianimarinicoccus marinus TaxID=3231483 RepID=A0ABV3L5W9_9RHOB